MAGETLYILFLDDYHSGDVLFLQGLSRALSRKPWKPAPVIIHGSGEHAEHLMESHGIFRSRVDGVLEIRSHEEHALVERALMGLNQKMVGLLTDAVVSSIGVIGAQRSVFVVDGGSVRARGAAWLKGICDRGVMPVVAANARDEATGGTGEIDLTTAVVALAEAADTATTGVEIVFFTKTNLPGLMEKGATRPSASLNEAELRDAVPDFGALERIVAAGFTAVVTNSNRLTERGQPSGTRIQPAS